MTKSARSLPRLAAVLGLVFCMAFALIRTPAEAASPVLILSPADAELGGTAKRSGAKIGNVGKNGGSVEGTASYSALDLPADGWYTLSVTYYSGSDDRYFLLAADGESYKLPCPSSGGFDKSAAVTIDMRLSKGGSLTVGSDWYGPDLGKIEIYEPERAQSSARVYENRAEETFTRGSLTLTLDRANGIWSFASGREAVVTDARAECVIDGVTIASDGFARHSVRENDNSVLFTHEEHPDFPGEMTETFFFDEARGAILTEVTLSSDGGVSTNRISPLVTEKVGGDAFLSIPYDNDMWVEPSLTPVGRISGGAVSYEVGALVETESGAGTVFGSVTHGTWKTGILLDASLGECAGFEVAGGYTDSGTRDYEPHGTLSGDAVTSPRIFIGRYADWRDGMEAFADACAETEPPVESVRDVPFGYNSWGVLQSKVSYGAMTAVSDYIRTHFEDVWGADGAPVYVNIDSFWDFLTINDPDCGLSLDEALRAFVKHCHDNGQKAGIYFTPFAAWHGDEDALKKSRIPGTAYTYYDAALKKADGSLYGKLDGGYALDPTHPGTIRRMEDQLRTFIDLGFEYVKLDFMAHGACEGVHYDPSAATGIQAYSMGMARIREICAGKMFVNLSIAPLFPYSYADGRRISCDAFSSLDNTRHVLSYLTACFWEKSLYPYPDPDHLVVWGKDGQVEEGAARCRVTAGAIAGTSFLVGDDLSDVEAGSAKEARLAAMFANPEIVGVAKLGRPFRPWKVTPGERCADTYFLAVGEARYFALFNFGEEAKAFRIPVDGLTEGTEISELWRGEVWQAEDGELVCTVPARDAAICKFTVSAASEAVTNEASETIPAAEQHENEEETQNAVSAQTEKSRIVPVLGILAGAAVLAGIGIAWKKRAGRR